MNFQNPIAWIWLAGLGAIVVLLYFLKMRRREMLVPATFLWPRSVEEIRANSFFQRPRWNLLLFLQLLALALLFTAFARPQLPQRGLTGAVTVLVVDVSASMGATDVQPTRLDEAKRVAATAVESAKSGDRIAIIEAGISPRVVCSLTSDTSRLLAAIKQIEPTDAPNDMSQALRLAASLVGSEVGGRITVLSDGSFPTVKTFSAGKASVAFQSIGRSTKNAAITAFGVGDSKGGKQFFVGARNFGLDALQATLTIYGDSKPIFSSAISVMGSRTVGKTGAVPIGTRVLEARIETPDYLKADNYAACAVGANTIRVLAVTPGDFFLERALGLDSRVTLDRASALPPSVSKQEGKGAYDVVIFDGVREEPVPRAGVLVFGAPGTAQSNPKILIKKAAPLLDGVDFEGVYVETCNTLKADDARALAESENGPVIVSQDEPKRKILVGFRPLNSDFPLSPSFPIFISNAIDYLASDVDPVRIVKMGERFIVPVSRAAKLVGPDGSSKPLTPDGRGVRLVRGVGRSNVIDGTTSREIFAQLIDDDESQIAPTEHLKIGNVAPSSRSTPTNFQDFWRYFALVALAVLCFEWWVFARKS